MFKNLVRRIRKSHSLSKSAATVLRHERARREHLSLVSKEGDWWFCRTTTAAARQLALQGAVVRVSRAAAFHPTREGPWRRIPGAL